MNAGEASAERFPEAVLPDADEAPAPLAELAINTFIAGHVVFAFAVPDGAVGFRAGVTIRATVTETSVDEDGDLILQERKVRLPDDGSMSSPTRNLVAPQQDQQRLLRR